MKLMKEQKVTKTTEEKVLEISESEFKEIVKDLLSDEVRANKELCEGDTTVAMALSINASVFASKLHSRLFKEEKSE